jgi:hypothetical protein
MKKTLANFSQNRLTRDQMKYVSGGVIRCTGTSAGYTRDFNTWEAALRYASVSCCVAACFSIEQ